MKTPALLRSFLVPLCLAVTCILLDSGASAQEKAAPPAQKPPPETATVKKINLEIKDGAFVDDAGKKTRATVGNLADYLRRTCDLNIVLSPGVREIVVRDLILKGADAEGFFDALGVATGNTVRAGRQSAGMWAVMARDRSSRRVEAFNLAGYLNSGGRRNADESLKELQVIIAETWHQLREGQTMEEEGPTFRFHSGANLLIVIGGEDAIEVARKVVNALPGQAGPTSHLLQVPEASPRPSR